MLRVRTSTEITGFINTDQKWISSCLKRVHMKKSQNTRSRTRDVSECSCHTVVFVIDDAWSLTLDTPSVPHLTLTGTHTLRGVNLETRNVSKRVSAGKPQHFKSEFDSSLPS